MHYMKSDIWQIRQGKRLRGLAFTPDAWSTAAALALLHPELE
jgi:hypothetical protein